MSGDEQAVRQLVETWFSASKARDLATVLDLMTDDVIFMVAGLKPFGKAAFASTFKAMHDVRMDGAYHIQEISILGDWAYLRNYIRMEIIPADGAPVHRSGYTLTILRKEQDGTWRIARDANLLSAETSPHG